MIRIIMLLYNTTSEEYSHNDSLLASSLQTLSSLLYKHYGEKTFLLIDEY